MITFCHYLRKAREVTRRGRAVSCNISQHFVSLLCVVVWTSAWSSRHPGIIIDHLFLFVKSDSVLLGSCAHMLREPLELPVIRAKAGSEAPCRTGLFTLTLALSLKGEGLRKGLFIGGERDSWGVRATAWQLPTKSRAGLPTHGRDTSGHPGDVGLASHSAATGLAINELGDALIQGQPRTNALARNSNQWY